MKKCNCDHDLEYDLIDMRAELEVRSMERDERARRRELYASWPWYRRLLVWWGNHHWSYYDPEVWGWGNYEPGKSDEY